MRTVPDEELKTRIGREELKARIDRGERFTLVETLPRAAFEQGHIPGAINLPPDEIAKLAPSLLPDQAADIVVYCAKPT